MKKTKRSNKMLASVAATTMLATGLSATAAPQQQNDKPMSFTERVQKQFAMNRQADAAGGYEISGRAWFENGPSTQPAIERNLYNEGEDFKIVGLTVILKNDMGQVIQTVQTGNDGYYHFTDVPDGRYNVSFQAPTLTWSPVTNNIDTSANADPALDSDGPTDALVVVNGADRPYIDQGYYNAAGATVNDGRAPVINDLSDVSGYVNQPLSDITVTADEGKATVTVDGLPPGMTFTPATDVVLRPDGTQEKTGTISGTPTAVGDYPVTVTAVDEFGNQSTETFIIHVNKVPNDAPVLVVNDTPVNYGDNFDPKSIATATDKEKGDLTDQIVISGDTVDTTKPGVYNVTYTVTDGENTETKTVKVTVGEKPNTAPVLVVSDTTIGYGSTFDPTKVATATDAEQGDISKDIKVSGDTVDTNKPGDYTVTFSVTDDAGVTIEETVKITVAEKPNEAPVLTVKDATVDYGSTFDPKTLYTVTDDKDSDIADRVVITGDTVDTKVPGTYNVIITATDSFGTATSKSATVTVGDKPNSAPVLTVDDTTIPYGSTFDPEKVASATDADNDKVTITVSGDTVDTNKPGDYNVVFTATDDDGATDTKTVTITVADKPNGKPVLVIDKTDIPQGSDFDINDYVSATDPDGDKVTITSTNVDTSKPGEVKVIVTADDGNGGTDTKEITFNVFTNDKPVITADPMVVKVGETFNPKTGVKASDTEDKDLTDKIEVVENNVNTAKAGRYTVTYRVADKDNNVTTFVREIAVSSNQKPVLFVYDQFVAEGAAYDEMDNAMAFDHEDGDLTDKIELKSGKVDTSKPGTYDLTYSVTDEEDNTSERTVTVTVGNDWSDDIAALNSNMNDMQGQLDDLNDKYKDLLDKYGALDARVTAVEAKIDQIEKAIQDIKTQISALDSAVKDLNDKYNSLNVEVGQIKDSIKEINDKLTQLETSVKNLDDKYNELVKIVEQNTKDIGELKGDVSDIKKDNADLHDTVDDITKQINDLNDKLEVIKNTKGDVITIINNNTVIVKEDGKTDVETSTETSTEKPTTEKPSTEAPKGDSTEKPSTETPKGDSTEKPTTEKPSTEAPKGDSTEKPTTEQVTTEGVDKPSSSDVSTENPTTETPVVADNVDTKVPASTASQVDTNNDGTVSASEAATADTNNDGTVSKQEAQLANTSSESVNPLWYLLGGGLFIGGVALIANNIINRRKEV